MKVFLIKRLLHLIPTLFGICLISFFLMQLAPGGPVDQMTDLNPNVTAESKARIRHEMGLDKPITTQFLIWMGKMATLDFGNSFSDKRPVIEKIMERLPATLLLNIASLALILLLSIPIGFWSAVRWNSWFDKTMTVLVYIGFSLPTYALGVGLMVVFGLQLGWLPLSGLTSMHFTDVPWWSRAWDVLLHLVLPTLTLALTGLAGLSRYMRSSMLEVLHQDYIRMAVAKGLAPKRVYGVHALRNALIPMVTLFGLMIPDLIGGGVIIETLFAYPGMGRLGYDAIMSRDYNVVMAITVISALLTVIGNFVADILYAYVDPRIRYK